MICQWLRRKPLAELLGKFDVRWLKELGLGGLIGSALMLFPALIMWIFGWVHWQWNPAGFSTLMSTALLFAGVAVAEELLFRGFVFQRLIAGLGEWPAQLIIRTMSLAMPIGLHFMANFMQGGVLGFGVSGAEQLGLLKPIFNEIQVWLTGGQFGLEASVPGLIFVAITLVLLYVWKPA